MRRSTRSGSPICSSTWCSAEREHPTPRGLNRAAEALGTELEGITGPDRVLLYATVRGDRAAAALDLLTQITSHPLLREPDIEHERQVVLREIAESLDDDESKATALIRRALFGGGRVGRDVAGVPDDVRRLDPGKVASFHQRQWTSRGGSVVIAGDLGHLDRARLLGQLAEIGTGGEPVAKAPISYRTGEVRVAAIDGDTAHLRLAYDVPGIDLTSTKDEATAVLVSQMLGGPMSSRLVTELREVNPLCYWIDAGVWGYETAAFLSIRCSVAVEKLEETLERITAIVGSLRRHGPDPGEVEHFRVVSEQDVNALCRSIGARPCVAYVGPEGPQPSTLAALVG